MPLQVKKIQVWLDIVSPVMKCLGVPPGPRQAPTDISHFGANVVAGLVHVILIMIARHTLATTIRELWKKHKQASKQCLLPTSSRGYMSYLGPQGKFVDRERTCKDLGFCFYGGLSVPKKRKKKRKLHGWGGLTLHPVELLAVRLPEVAVFEVGASAVRS